MGEMCQYLMLTAAMWPRLHRSANACLNAKQQCEDKTQVLLQEWRLCSRFCLWRFAGRRCQVLPLLHLTMHVAV